VAALAGTVFFALVGAVERRVTFWHPSHRGRR
jgi:NitT/TauT family transport system permease protein